MTPTELMKPRYKVIADYPNNNVAVGTIYSDATGRHFINGLSNISRIILEKHPHLFKKLEWWEERKESDMPEYVKNIKTGIVEKFTNYWWIDRYLPATESEYINQKTIE